MIIEHEMHEHMEHLQECGDFEICKVKVSINISGTAGFRGWTLSDVDALSLGY